LPAGDRPPSPLGVAADVGVMGTEDVDKASEECSAPDDIVGERRYMDGEGATLP
jgi:hypothetical protein